MHRTLESAIADVDSKLAAVLETHTKGRMRERIRVRIIHKLAKELMGCEDPEEQLGWGRSCIGVRDGRIKPTSTEEDRLHPTLILTMAKEVSPPRFYIGEC